MSTSGTIAYSKQPYAKKCSLGYYFCLILIFSICKSRHRPSVTTYSDFNPITHGKENQNHEIHGHHIQRRKSRGNLQFQTWYDHPVCRSRDAKKILAVQGPHNSREIAKWKESATSRSVWARSEKSERVRLFDLNLLWKWKWKRRKTLVRFKNDRLWQSIGAWIGNGIIIRRLSLKHSLKQILIWRLGKTARASKTRLSLSVLGAISWYFRQEKESLAWSTLQHGCYFSLHNLAMAWMRFYCMRESITPNWLVFDTPHTSWTSVPSTKDLP